jgi:hypothetical protein
MSEASYAADFYTWAKVQADAARRRSANEMDWENVAEELEGLAGQQAWELYNRLVVLLLHLSKWRHQPERRGPSWEATVRVQRRDIARLMRRAPGLQSVLDDEFVEAYGTARLKAADEMMRSAASLPEAPPFTVEQALDPEFWPDAAETR